MASSVTTTTTCSLHRRTVTIRDPSSDEYYSSREELLTQNDTEGLDSHHPRELDIRRSPTPAIEDPGTSAWHIWSAQAAADPWGNAAPTSAINNPDYPTGSWNPGDYERASAQNARDAPDPIFATDNVYIEDEHIDASPPYFRRGALAIPRARNGLHSPAYDRHDPFAALQRNYIPFPTARRNQIQAVPFGQWPSESDTSDSSDESNWSYYR